MISFELLWETMKKKASCSINSSKNTKSAPASWTDCAKTGMSAPTPSTSSASVLLGAGRQKKGDPLDFAAGITLHKKRGDYVHKGESLATFYGAADKFEAAAAEYRSGLVYGAEKPEEAPLVYALVTKDGVERY